MFNIFKCRQVSAYTKNNSIFTTFVFSLLNIYFCVILVDTNFPGYLNLWGTPSIMKAFSITALLKRECIINVVYEAFPQ